MARILIRPDELAHLARRYDSAADDLRRVARRLARARAETHLNPADESISVPRVVERASLIEASLRRSAVDFGVDAAALARTVVDAELADGGWTSGLTSTGAVGVESVALVGSFAWESVAAGLTSLGAAAADRSAVGSAQAGPVAAGGLFAVGSSDATATEGHLAALADRLGRSASSQPGSGHPGTVAATGAVWNRIVGELFADDHHPPGDER